MLSATVVQGALEVGVIYGLVAMALFLSFSILNIADMTTDGCFTLGCAVSATMTVAGHPFMGLVAAVLAGACAGFITALLQTRLGVPSILAGIITNTGLYTINIMAMGFTTNVSLFGSDTIYSLLESKVGSFGGWAGMILSCLIVLLAAVLLMFFMGTRLGMSIRATGDNADMVRASSIDPRFTTTVGLSLANAMTGLSGGMIAQYQGTSDINLGTGMVVIGLASLIIGETLFGRSKMPRWILGVIGGSVIYRFIIALALHFNVPAESLKLVSALIVTIAIAAPAMKSGAKFRMQKKQSEMEMKEGGRA